MLNAKINDFKDLKEKEAIIQKEAMIKAKEALHNEREQLNEDERERRREFAAIETKLSKREDLIENKIQELTDKEVSLDKMKDKIIEKEDVSLLPYPNSFENQILEIGPKGQKSDDAYNTFFNKDTTKTCFFLNKEILLEKKKIK